jgi:hypothetical protein
MKSLPEADFPRVVPKITVLAGVPLVALLAGSIVRGQAVPDSDIVRQTSVEVVTAAASTGDGGQAWGGHQTRIVRTVDGVFTAYTANGAGPLAREWRLVQRTDERRWDVIARGTAGKDPVNLLAAPSGTLYVIGWPDGVGSTYVFPDPLGQLSLVATRDVRWSALGYQQPPGSFDYVFNAFRYWRSRDVTSKPVEPFTFVEEPPTRDDPEPYLNAQMDA